MCYHVLPCIAMYYHVLLCIAMDYHVLPCTSMYYHVLPCIAMYCHVILCITMYYGSFENEDRRTKHPNLENEAPKTRKRSTQNSKTKHPNLENEAPKTRKRRPLNLENEAPKTRNHCRFNKCNFTSYMTQSESGGGSGCVRTSKGPQNPSQGFITNCFTERF